jgi:hypothetical protein
MALATEYDDVGTSKILLYGDNGNGKITPSAPSGNDDAP